MKLLRSVCIMFIGIMSLTAFGTTTERDQKPQTEFIQEVQKPVTFVNVATDFYFVANAALNEVVFTVSNYKSKTSTNFTAIITDVGWQTWQRATAKSVYKEKLNPDFNISFLDRINRNNIFKEVRDNC